jgi:hypothetical protein
MSIRPSKPGERRGGRQVGTPNKITADLKAMILGALDDAGGQRYLAAQAAKNPNAFLTLVGKVLPMQLNHSVGASLASELSDDELAAIIRGRSGDASAPGKLH